MAISFFSKIILFFILLSIEFNYRRPSSLNKLYLSCLTGNDAKHACVPSLQVKQQSMIICFIFDLLFHSRFSIFQLFLSNEILSQLQMFNAQQEERVLL